MVLLTVIGRKQAKAGKEFTYMGPVADCKDCKVRNICFHLERGRRYRVVEIRDRNHQCPVHEEGVSVVQVEEIPTESVIPARIAIEGSTVSYECPRCRNRGCGSWALCFPQGMEPGMKRKVAKVGDRVDCRIGQSRVRVILE
jgi:hypothetical protein